MASDSSNTLLSPVCRVCLQPSPALVTLFDLKYEDLTLNVVFETCTSLQLITENYPNLPAFICETCIVDLITTYRFIKRCHEADLKLKTDYSLRDTHNSSVIIKQECENVYSSEPIENWGKQCNLEEKPFSCDMCSQKCNRTFKINFASAAKEKNPSQSYSCGACNKIFDKPLDWGRHLITHSQPESGRLLHKKSIKIRASKPFQCEICCLLVTTKGALRFHMMKHTGEKPHICVTCGKGFIQKVSLEEHKKLHTGETPFVCEYCGKAFRSNTSYKWHSEIHSSTEDPVPCGTCDKVLRSQQAWKKHQTIHNKRFLCNQCGTSFQNKTQLTDHINNHLGIKPYRCNICFKTFVRKNHLTKHSFAHLKVKPHQCDKCSKSYVSKTKLAIHKKRHH